MTLFYPRYIDDFTEDGDLTSKKEDFTDMVLCIINMWIYRQKSRITFFLPTMKKPTKPIKTCDGSKMCPSCRTVGFPGESQPPKDP
jgi:hypothetical protein